MGFRFRKSVTLFKGFKLNFSSSGVSATVGGRGHSVTYGKRGTYVNLGIPGTGVSFRTKVPEAKKRKSSGDLPSKSRGRGGVRDYGTPSYSAPIYSNPAYAKVRQSVVEVGMVRTLAEEVLTLPVISTDYVQKRWQVSREKAEEFMAKLADIGVISPAKEDGVAEVLMKTESELNAVWDAYIRRCVASSRAQRDPKAISRLDADSHPVSPGVTHQVNGCLLVFVLLMTGVLSMCLILVDKVLFE